MSPVEHAPPVASASPEASRLARDSLTVGLATVLSRILGFVRDILIARALGAGPVADAFLVAFRLPNMFRRVLGEGGLNAPLVPVYLKTKAEHGEDAARRFAGEAAGTIGAGLLLLVALTEIIAPWLVLALAGGFRDEPATYRLAVDYTRLALPFVAFTVLASLLAAILNAERRFLVAALAPISLNLVLIGVLVWGQWAEVPAAVKATTLAAGVSVGGIIHLVIILWALGWKRPHLPRQWPRFRLGSSPALRRLLRLGVPALLASATAQFVLLVATQIASSQPGAVSWLYYADRVFQMPLGFVAVAMGIVLLPAIAASEVTGDAAARQHTVDQALTLGLVLALPASAALFVLAELIVAVLFERGQFGAVDRVQTSAALQAFALGLPPAVIAKVLAQVCFARQAPGMPLAVGAASVVVAALAGLWLSPGMPATGAAAAASLAFWTQGLLLALALSRQGLWHLRWPLMRAVLLALGATTLMAGAVMAAHMAWGGRMVGKVAGVAEFALLAAICIGGLAVYAALAWMAGLLTVSQMSRSKMSRDPVRE